MLKNSSIFAKVFISHLSIGLVSVISLSVIFYLLFQHALIERTIDQLSSINILKKHQIEQYFRSIRKNIEFQSASAMAAQDEIDNLKQRFGFESVWMVDDDFRKQFTTEPDSLLEHLITARPQIDSFRIIDVSLFLPLKNVELVYAIPIVQGSRPIGYIFIRDKFEKIQSILGEVTGMGNTGESYLVGADLRMRSSSRFMPNASPLTIPVSTEATENAFKGVYRYGIIKDYRGINVLNVHRSLESKSLNWVLVSEIDYSEAMKPIVQWRNFIIGAAVFLMMVILAVTYFIANSIAEPILYLKGIISVLAQGIIPSEEVKVTDPGEVGEIARAIRELTNGLKRTTQFADEIGVGNFKASFTTLSDKDTLGLALISMRDKLRTLTDDQVRLVREKTGALLEGQEHERKRIVQELHDGVGQLLTAVRLRVEMLEHRETTHQEIAALVNETIEEIRRISYNLMPNSIVDFGLGAALEGLCNDIRKAAPIVIDFNFIQEYQHTLPFEISIAVYRIIQEGFNNILKHAGATHVDLNFLVNENEIYFLLKDNGKGFESAAQSSRGFGLRSMEERAKLLKGVLEIHTAPGQGTVIEVTIPFELR